jgi:molybdopterin converting factor small subunit
LATAGVEGALIITVRFVSPLNNLAGTDQASVEVPADATVAELVRSLGELYPALSPATKRVTFLVNRRHVPQDTALSDGDQVFVLQVLGGG